MRIDSQAGANGSESSLASSASDDLQQQASRRLQRNHSAGAGLSSGGGGGGAGGKAAVTRVASMGSAGTPGQGLLLHSLSTNDASVNEYKYTVSVGSHNLKITGDCFELVRVAKLVLDDYFSGQEFLGAADAVPSSTPVTPASESKLNPFATPVVPASHQIGRRQFVDSGIGLNIMGQAGDDEVFIVESGEWRDVNRESGRFNCNFIKLIAERSLTGSSNNSSIATSTPNSTNSSLARSRRGNFEQSSSTATTAVAADGNGNDQPSVDKIRILYEYERLVQYSKSPHAWALPADWTKICLKAPNIVRNKVNEESAKILETVYSWLVVDSNNNNSNGSNPPNTSTTNHVKFQRNLSFDESRTTEGFGFRKSFDAKRNPLVHSKSVCD